MKDIDLDDWHTGVGRELAGLTGFVELLKRAHNPYCPMESQDFEHIGTAAEVLLDALKTKLDALTDEVNKKR